MADQKTESEKTMKRTLELGDTLLTAFFRDQDTLMKVISQLPYVEYDPPYLTERAGTACQAISNIRLEDGTVGFSLITGGDLTPEEIQTAVDLLNKYGEEQLFTFASEESPGQPKAKGSPDQPTTVIQELRRQRENTERCLTILTQCRTRDEILEGFGRIATLLRQANDPLADAAEMAFTGCRGLPDEHVLQLRNDFIVQCRAFLSSTATTERETTKARAAKQEYKRASGASLQVRKTNGLAITSLILGIVAIPLGCCYGSGALFGVAAFITGLIGHRQTKESGGAQSGEGMALAGMILGGVSVLVGLEFIGLLVLGLLGQGESGF